MASSLDAGRPRPGFSGTVRGPGGRAPGPSSSGSASCSAAARRPAQRQQGHAARTARRAPGAGPRGRHRAGRVRRRRRAPRRDRGRSGAWSVAPPPAGLARRPVGRRAPRPLGSAWPVVLPASAAPPCSAAWSSPPGRGFARAPCGRCSGAAVLLAAGLATLALVRPTPAPARRSPVAALVGLTLFVPAAGLGALLLGARPSRSSAGLGAGAGPTPPPAGHRPAGRPPPAAAERDRRVPGRRAGHGLPRRRVVRVDATVGAGPGRPASSRSTQTRRAEHAGPPPGHRRRPRPADRPRRTRWWPR